MRNLVRLFSTAILLTSLMLLTTSAYAAQGTSHSTFGRTTVPGGMVKAGMVKAGSKTPQGIYGIEAPSCRSIRYTGPDGYIDVQTSLDNRVQWGITMVPLSKSIGRWDVDTYVNNVKTSSGFHTITTTNYIPHGSLSVPGGGLFRVSAQLVSIDGHIYYNVPNLCEIW